MRSLIFFFQSPVNGSFRDQFEKLNGELLYLACPTREFRKSSSWSNVKGVDKTYQWGGAKVYPLAGD